MAWSVLGMSISPIFYRDAGGNASSRGNGAQELHHPRWCDSRIRTWIYIYRRCTFANRLSLKSRISTAESARHLTQRIYESLRESESAGTTHPTQSMCLALTALLRCGGRGRPRAATRRRSRSDWSDARRCSRSRTRQTPRAGAESARRSRAESARHLTQGIYEFLREQNQPGT